VRSAAGTNEQAILGITTGLIGDGQEVEWRARHFGLWFNMRVRITGFRPPVYFQDTMVEGPFRSFVHDHNFENENAGTLMTDRFVFASPIPVAGPIIDRLILKSHLLSFVRNRNLELKKALESPPWQPH
jgi:ligand-binding SRPBCC domain-containing protein